MVDKENVPTKAQGSSLPQLHNRLGAGSLIDQSLANLSKEQATNIYGEAAKARLELETKKRIQEMDYFMGRKAAEDHTETFNMLEKRGKLTRQYLVSDIKTGAGNMRIESKSGAMCFVASVAYSESIPSRRDLSQGIQRRGTSEVVVRRDFARLVLAQWTRIARLVDKSNLLREATRRTISFLVFVLRKL